MSERQILEMGIRAMGIVFLFQAIADAQTYAFAFAISHSGFVALGFVLTQVATAIVVIRFASQISSCLTRRETNLPALQLMQIQDWNRWLMVTAATYGIATQWLQPIINSARYLASNVVGDDKAIAAYVAFTTMHSALLVGMLYTMFSKPNWILGNHDRDL